MNNIVLTIALIYNKYLEFQKLLINLIKVLFFLKLN